MNYIPRAIYIFGFVFLSLTLLSHPIATAEKNKPRPPKPTLGVGVTFDSGGRLWLAKVKDQQLFVSWSRNAGKTFSKPIAVTSEHKNISADGENRPKIAVARDGTVLLTWTQSLPKQYSGNVLFSRSTDSGKSFSKPIVLNDDGRITSHRFDTLVIDGEGKVDIAWLDARDRDLAREQGQPFLGTSMYTVSSDDNGTSFSANRQFHKHICECCRIGSTWTEEGPIIFWRNLFDNNVRDFAIANLHEGNIKRATDDEWEITACPHHGGDIALDGENTLHLVWFTNGKTRQGLFYRHIKDDQKSQPIHIGDLNARSSHPSVAAAGNSVLITWREFDGKEYAAKMMRSDDGGLSWSKSQHLANSSGATDYPIPLMSNEQTLVIWNTAMEGLHIMPVDWVASK